MNKANFKTTITGFNDEGDGFGYHNGKKVVVPKTVRGDVVEFSIVKENKDYIVGKLEEILEYSHHRRNPMMCPIFGRCGGCSLQHLDDTIYYDFKNKILENAIEKSGYELKNTELVKIEGGSRRRVVFQVGDGVLGFFNKNSKDLVNLHFCTLLCKEINKIIPNLKKLIKFLKLENIEITSYENGLNLVFTFKKNAVGLSVEEYLKEFAFENKEILGISFRNGIDDKHPSILIQKKFPRLSFSNGITIELNSNTFLQATKKGQEDITKVVIDALKNCKTVADLYCGVGTYTFPLSDFASKIYSVEGDVSMVQNLMKNIKSNNLSGKITAEARDLVNQPLLKKELDKFEGIVINPPRNGAKAQCEFLAQSNVDRVVVVSCNPKTFSPDASKLRDGGYELERVVGVDQFYWTPHLEIIGIFKK